MKSESNRHMNGKNDNPAHVDPEKELMAHRNSDGQAVPEPGPIGTNAVYFKDCPFVMEKDCNELFLLMQKIMQLHSNNNNPDDYMDDMLKKD